VTRTLVVGGARSGKSGYAESVLADGARMLSDLVDQASLEERTDPGIIKEKLRAELRRFFRKRSGRRPFVLPVIMEI